MKKWILVFGLLISMMIFSGCGQVTLQGNAIDILYELIEENTTKVSTEKMNAIEAYFVDTIEERVDVTETNFVETTAEKTNIIETKFVDTTVEKNNVMETNFAETATERTDVIEANVEEDAVEEAYIIETTAKEATFLRTTTEMDDCPTKTDDIPELCIYHSDSEKLDIYTVEDKEIVSLTQYNLEELSVEEYGVFFERNKKYLSMDEGLMEYEDILYELEFKQIIIPENCEVWRAKAFEFLWKLMTGAKPICGTLDAFYYFGEGV